MNTHARPATVAFKTLGCRLNQAETDQMAEDLATAGFRLVPESQDPDVVIINTCTVTQEATRASRRTARKAVGDHPDAAVVVAGCYAVAEPEEARSIEGVAMVVSNDDKERIAEQIASRLGAPERAASPLLQIGPRPGARTHLPTGALPGGRTPLPTGALPGGRTRINLKVQTGCDEFCSFCIIPYTRGALRSSPLEDLLATARRKVEAGARELVLTGVHLGKYGWDWGKPDDALVALLEGLLCIDDLARIRLSSILSRHLSERVVEMMQSEDRICRFLHIPLQSGADEVLRRMNRPYRIGEYLETIERVRSALPEVGITTDIIVGFPGETPSQFEQTLRVVQEVGYLKLHVFRYSPRPGTPSAEFHDQIPEDEKRRRSKELIALGNRLRLSFHEREVGRTREVFVEEAFDSGELSGHTDNFVKVTFKGPRDALERLTRVEVTEPGVQGVKGRFVKTVNWEDASPRT